MCSCMFLPSFGIDWYLLSTWNISRYLTIFRSSLMQADLILLNTAISVCAWGSWQNSLSLLFGLEMWKLQADEISFNSALNALEKSASWEHALVLLFSMARRDLISYNTAISACGKGTNWQGALSLMSHLETETLQPDLVTMNSAMSACEKAGQWEGAFHLLGSLPTRQLSGNAISHTAAISSCNEMRKWQLALDYFTSLQNEDLALDIVTFNAVITTCAKAVQWKEALALLAPAIYIILTCLPCGC